MIADVRRLVQLALDLWERSEPKAPAQTPVAGLERATSVNAESAVTPVPLISPLPEARREPEK